MINYMKFDVMWMDDVIASVDLKPANGRTPYVINYITDFNSGFFNTVKLQCYRSLSPHSYIMGWIGQLVLYYNKAYRKLFFTLRLIGFPTFSERSRQRYYRRLI